MENAKGRLITIEAGDGSGKATQTNALYDRLKREGYDVLKVEYPDYGMTAVRTSRWKAAIS